MYSHHFFTVLKERVLAKAGVKHLIPSECQKLSNFIFTSTKKNVSETTLKRIYGFAVSKFKPSAFTLQVLSEYCGYESWEAFCKHDDLTENISVEKNTWKLMCNRANRTTQFTLQSLKKRSGIPYNFTIKRKFMIEHFNAFLQTDKTATFFTSQAGYGKTIGLCHVVEDLLNENTSNNYDKNVILFFSTHTINADNLNFSEWLLSFLGFPSIKSLIDLFEENESNQTNFYLIIDGFDDYNFKQDQYFSFFNQLVDIISYYSRFSWFKIVLTMRSSTWINYRYLVEDKALLWEKWFSGFMLDEDKTTNVLPFDTDEILTLSQNINPQSKLSILPSAELIQKLSYPLFFQLYYQHNPDHFSIAEIDYLSFYQVISAFAYSKIYHGKNSMEKVLTIKTFLEMLDYNNNSFSIPKIKFYDHIKLHPTTYKELVGNTIIKEENFSKYLQYQEQISFANCTLFEYFIAKKFHFWNNEKLDQKLVIEIDISIGKSIVKVPVIKWLIFFIINSNDYEQLSCLQYLILESTEKLDIIIFTCKLLQKKLTETKDHEKLKLYFLQIQENGTFSFFLSLQYITPDYEKALHTLLNFDLSDRNKILIYTTLALNSIFSLNAVNAEKYIEEINVYPDDEIENFIINPLLCLDAIYSYFKYGFVKNETLQTLTHLSFNNYQLLDMHHAAYNYNEIILKLALLTSRLYNNPIKELKFIHTITKHFKSAGIKENTTLQTFYYGFEANAYLRSGNLIKSLKIQNQFLTIRDSAYNAYTPFMKVFLNMLTVRTSMHNQAGKVALLQVKSLIAYCNKNSFNFAGVYTAVNYLNVVNIDFVNLADIAEIYNYILRSIRSSGFRLESFITTELQNRIENLINKKNQVA